MIVLGILIACLFILDAEAAASGTLSISNVVVGPTNVSVGQNVKMSVTFDTNSLAGNIGKSVNVTYSYPGGRFDDSAIIQGNTVVLGNFVTPGTSCTVTYVIDAAGQASKTGSFIVYGPAASFIFEVKGSPLILTDGTIVTMANGYSTQKFMLTARDIYGNIINASGIRITSSMRGSLSYVLDTYSRAIVTIGPGFSSSSETIIASVDGVAGVKSYTLRFVDGKLKIKACNDTNEISRTKIGDFINVTVTLTDGTAPLGDVPVAIKCIWPSGVVDMVNSRTYNTTASGIDAGTIEINNKFTAGLINSNTINVFIAQVPGLGLLDAITVSGYSTNAHSLDLYVAPADPNTDGTSYNVVQADGIHYYTIIARVADEHGNNVVGAPVEFDTYANLDADGDFTDEVTSIYNATTSDLGTASAGTQPSLNPGKIKVRVQTNNNLAKDVILYYSAGAPSRINIAAYPDIIANSLVQKQKDRNITYNVNETKLVVYLTDEPGHPISGRRVNLTVLPDINGKINGRINPSSGITDVSGEFAATFSLGADVKGDGSVTVNATFDNLATEAVITYTNNSYLNITTTVNKSYVAVNGTIGVTVTVDGVGYQAGRPPADVIFVMDRSGSMGDAMGFTNYGSGTNAGGWFNGSVAYAGTDLAKGTTTSILYNHDKATRMIFKIWQQPPAATYPATTAQFVGNTLPDTMKAGTSQVVSVTVKNTGDIQWMDTSYLGSNSISEQVRLYGRNGSVSGKGSFADQNIAITPASKIVAVGDQYTFTFTITAPLVSSNTIYYPYYRMYWANGKGWFGDTLPHPIMVYPDVNNMPTPAPTATPTPQASIVTSNIPATLNSGQTYAASVTMRNNGAFPWNYTTPAYKYGLGFSGSYSTFGITTPLNLPVGTQVNPGDTYQFNFIMTAPTVYNTDASYTITYQMTDKGSTWGGGSSISFGSSGTNTTKVIAIPVPKASALYGDWYYYKILFPNGTATGYASWADKEATLSNSTTPLIIPKGQTIPTVGSNGAGLGANSYAPPGVYTIQTTRYYEYGSDVPFKSYIWDDMKMGQISDQNASAKRNANFFINSTLINGLDRAALVTFSDTASLDRGLTHINLKPGGIPAPTGSDVPPGQWSQNKTTLETSINNINSRGVTNLADALKTARLEFAAKTAAGSNATKIEILLTDGYSTSSYNDDESEAQLAAKDNITIFAIGLASDPLQVNSTFLNYLATLTGGKYFFVRDNAQLLEAYQQIGVIINQHITQTSNLSIVPDGTKIDSLWSPNMTYVAHSAYVNNGSMVVQTEPTESYVNGNYSLLWPIDPMSIGGRWILNYTMFVNRAGASRPVGLDSNVYVLPYDNTNPSFTQYFHSDVVNVGTNGTLTNTSIMGIKFTLPDESAEIAQPYQVIAWNVSYNATGSYTQLVEFAPEGTNDYRPIASGFGSNKSGSFDTVWDIAQMNVGKGLYTIRITATDGMFATTATRDVRISYLSGLIKIGEPDTKVLY